MIFRFVILLIGFGFAVSGGVSLLAYLNLLATGYTIEQFANFIIYRIEFYILLFGGLLITCSLYFPSRKKKE
ncbi:hypothetical protein [Bacillus alkalicellulosilyticus]|uniref:hypothetical protein n=1 Tax=Alkalihalobacterium alkalicellulosilyticum TaxID=1912214 RepID=UPI0009975B0D|nr:hypothetical protein [Bacillus alkalicellulosilyticus]